jgi:hypothetical protein
MKIIELVQAEIGEDYMTKIVSAKGSEFFRIDWSFGGNLQMTYKDWFQLRKAIDTVIDKATGAIKDTTID